MLILYLDYQKKNLINGKLWLLWLKQEKPDTWSGIESRNIG